jgi:transcription elongation factor Elf1
MEALINIETCHFCQELKQTQCLVLNGGDVWLDFCDDCGEKETLTNSEGATATVMAIFKGKVA